MTPFRSVFRSVHRPVFRSIFKWGAGGVLVVLVAPEGVYPGAPAGATGGTGPYTWVVNGVETGIPFEDVIDATFTEGDVIQVMDSEGVLSNALIIQGIPEEPVNVTPPEITGVAIPLSVLNLSNGTWTGVVDYYTYRWEIDSVDAGVTTNTLLIPADTIDGALIQGFVTAHNFYHAIEAPSNIVAVSNPTGFAFLRQPDNTVIMQPDGTPIQHPV